MKSKKRNSTRNRFSYHLCSFQRARDNPETLKRADLARAGARHYVMHHHPIILIKVHGDYYARDPVYLRSPLASAKRF